MRAVFGGIAQPAPDDQRRGKETTVGSGKDGWRMRVIGPDNFGHMILENLRKAGVQNTRQGEPAEIPIRSMYIPASGSMASHIHGDQSADCAD